MRCLHAQPDSACSILEWHAPPASGGPPLHVHRHTEEGIYVVHGSLALFIEGQELILEAGSYTLVRPGQEHTFWNPATAPAVYLTPISPPGFEQYLLELARGLARVRSDDEAAALRAQLADRYDIEILGPPKPAG